MEKVLDIPSTQIEYYKEKSLFKVIRNVSEVEEEEKYKEDVLQWQYIILKYKPKKQLMDMRKNNFTISPEMQRWVNENIVAQAVQNGTKKLAFIVSQDIFARVSLEQAMEEEEAAAFIIKYFDEEKEAMEWILKD